MKKLLLPASLLICIMSVYAQKKEGKLLIDSLLEELPKTKNDTGKVNLLNSLSHNYQDIHAQKGLEYGRQALQLAQKLKWKKGTAASYINIGLAYEKQYNSSKALENYFTALKISEEIGDKREAAYLYKNIGNVYYSRSYHPEALKNYFSALKIWEKIGDKWETAYLYNSIGNVYYVQKQYPEALENYSTCLKLREETGDKRGIAVLYHNIGLIYANEGNDSEALKNHFASLEIKKEIADKQGTSYSYIHIATIYERKGNYAEALKNLFAALQIKKEIGDKSGEAGVYLRIGSICLQQNKAVDARAWLQKSLNLSHGAHSYLMLAQIDSALGNHDKAYENYKMYVLYRDSAMNVEEDKAIKQMEMQWEFEKKEAAVKVAQEKKDIRQRNIRNAITAGLGITLIILVGIYRQRNRISKEKKISEALRVQSDSLLHNILPEEVAAELKAKGNAEARQFDDVTVLFTDFVNFTKTSERLNPKELVAELHECFKAFDDIISKHNIEKIKTIGDAYLAVCGLPVSDERHAKNIVNAAIEIKDFMHRRKLQTANSRLPTFEIRIGIHSGPVVAGIVGVKKFAYDIWGDTVNTAARMEQSSEAGKINISEATYQALYLSHPEHSGWDKYAFTYRGEIEAKNKGAMKMYFVETINKIENN